MKECSKNIFLFCRIGQNIIFQSVAIDKQELIFWIKLNVELIIFDNTTKLFIFIKLFTSAVYQIRISQSMLILCLLNLQPNFKKNVINIFETTLIFLIQPQSLYEYTTIISCDRYLI